MWCPVYSLRIKAFVIFVYMLYISLFSFEPKDDIYFYIHWSVFCHIVWLSTNIPANVYITCLQNTHFLALICYWYNLFTDRQSSPFLMHWNLRSNNNWRKLLQMCLCLIQNSIKLNKMKHWFITAIVRKQTSTLASYEAFFVNHSSPIYTYSWPAAHNLMSLVFSL